MSSLLQPAPKKQLPLRACLLSHPGVGAACTPTRLPVLSAESCPFCLLSTIRHTPGGQYIVSNISVSWAQLGLPAGTRAAVRDLYAEADLGTFTDSFTAEVTAHDVRVVRIAPQGGLAHDSWRPWHTQPIAAAAAAGGGLGDISSSGAGASGRKMLPGQHSMYASA